MRPRHFLVHRLFHEAAIEQPGQRISNCLLAQFAPKALGFDERSLQLVDHLLELCGARVHTLLELDIDLPDGSLGVLPRGDIFGKDDDAALHVLAVPRTNFPTQELHRSIGAIEAIFAGRDDLALEGALMNGTPAIGNIRKQFVVRDSAPRLLPEPVVGHPAATGCDVEHLAVEHGDRNRRLIDEHAEKLCAVLLHGSFVARQVVCCYRY